SLDPQVHGKQHPAYLNANARYVFGSLLDYDALKKLVVDADIIFHEAAVVGVGQSQYEIRRYVENNSLGTANLLDILANHRHQCRKLIVAASMSSYGEGLYRCSTHGLVRPPLRSLEQMEAGDWELHCPVCAEYVSVVDIPETAELCANSIY